MKKIIIALGVLILLSIGQISAQRIALVDMQYILDKVPAYQMMNKQLESLNQKWQKELDQLDKDASKMFKLYKKEQVFLTDKQKKEREELIVAKEKEAYDLKHKYFGPKGELFKKREDLMKPIRLEVWKSLKNMAMKYGYKMIMDKGTSKIVYADPEIDLSKLVLADMGFEE